MQQSNENLTLPQTDHFSEAFQRFQASRLFDRLQKKYQVRPFFERAKPLKAIAEGSSYLLNVFSAATAFLLVFSFLKSLLPFQALAGFFAVAFLICLEGLKRFSLPVVFKTFFQFKRLNFGAVAFSVFLSVVSIGSSYFGAKEAVQLLTPEVKLVSLEEVRKPFEERLQQLQADKADAMKQTWKGKQTVQAAKRLNTIQDQEAQLQAALLQAVQQAETKNAESLTKHTSGKDLKAEHFAAVTLLFEMLLLLCLWYCEFYDFRSLAEFVRYEGKTGEKQAKNGSLSSAEHTHTEEKRTVIQPFSLNAMRYSCEHCNNGFERKTSWQKYCSTECRLSAHAERHNGAMFEPGRAKRKNMNENF